MNKNKEELKRKIESNHQIKMVSHLFKAFSDATRLKILLALEDGPLSVSALTYVLGMSQSAISHQLRILRDANLVIYDKIGKEVYYRLADHHVYTIFEQAFEHVAEEK